MSWDALSRLSIIVAYSVTIIGGFVLAHHLNGVAGPRRRAILRVAPSLIGGPWIIFYVGSFHGLWYNHLTWQIWHSRVSHIPVFAGIMLIFFMIYQAVVEAIHVQEE